MQIHFQSNNWNNSFKASFDCEDKTTKRYLNKFYNYDSKLALATELALKDTPTDDKLVFRKCRGYSSDEYFCLKNANTEKYTDRCFKFDEILPWLCGDMYYDKRLILAESAKCSPRYYMQKATELLRIKNG